MSEDTVALLASSSIAPRFGTRGTWYVSIDDEPLMTHLRDVLIIWSSSMIIRSNYTRQVSYLVPGTVVCSVVRTRIQQQRIVPGIGTVRRIVPGTGLT